MSRFNQIVWLDNEIFPKKVTKLRTAAREVPSERIIIEDTWSHGRQELHLVEKVWPWLDNETPNDCYLLSNIENFISFGDN